MSTAAAGKTAWAMDLRRWTSGDGPPAMDLRRWTSGDTPKPDSRRAERRGYGDEIVQEMASVSIAELVRLRLLVVGS
jgi:hypothetical protein